LRSFFVESNIRMLTGLEEVKQEPKEIKGMLTQIMQYINVQRTSHKPEGISNFSYY